MAPTHALARWLFLRLIGLVYFCAFASLAVQIVGLVGTRGILPAGVGDTTLRAICVGGTAVSAALMLGILPIVAVPLLWLSYLWLANVCGEFLWYQWDALLLEAGFLAVFLAPATVRDRRRDAADPPRLAVWLMWWLIFRLMLGSGAVKLASGDPTWRGLTALTFHYETQPIPNPVAYYAHHLPVAFNKVSTAAILAIELIAPFMIVGPRRLKMAAAALFIGVQALIAVTGNFAFFNLLAAALCVFLLDDEAWRFLGPRREGSAEGGRIRQVGVMAAAIVVVPVSLFMFTSSLGLELPGWRVIGPIADLIAPLRSVNTYGLFAVMTTTRPEIVVEGSDDGERWSAYEFKYKPGDLKRRPPWVAPHQPRLDWQMWFAALGRYEENRWFQAFCGRLLEGSPDVLRLLDHDPFSGHPPRYVHGVLYRYRFAGRAAHRADGVWWMRERLGDYSPVLSLASPGR